MDLAGRVCLSGLGWKVSRGNMAAGLLPNPPKGKTQRADLFLDRCSVWGSSPDSPIIQSCRLSPHAGPAHPETYGLMYSLMTERHFWNEAARCLISTKKCAAGDAARLHRIRYSWSCPEVQSIWALLMWIWQGADDISLPLDSKLCEICHFNDHLSSHLKPVWAECKCPDTPTPCTEILGKWKSFSRVIDWNV